MQWIMNANELLAIAFWYMASIQILFAAELDKRILHEMQENSFSTILLSFVLDPLFCYLWPMNIKKEEAKNNKTIIVCVSV